MADFIDLDMEAMANQSKPLRNDTVKSSAVQREKDLVEQGLMDSKTGELTRKAGRSERSMERQPGQVMGVVGDIAKKGLGVVEDLANASKQRSQARMQAEQMKKLQREAKRKQMVNLIKNLGSGGMDAVINALRGGE